MPTDDDFNWLCGEALQVYFTITCGQIVSEYTPADEVLSVWRDCEVGKVEEVLDAVFTRLENGETVADLRKEFDL